MSGAYARTMFTDLIYQHAHIDDCIDIRDSIYMLLAARQVTLHHVHLAVLYAKGYEIEELQVYEPNVVAVLTQFFSLLAATAGYDDETIVAMQINKHRWGDESRKIQNAQSFQNDQHTLYRAMVEHYSHDFSHKEEQMREHTPAETEPGNRIKDIP